MNTKKILGGLSAGALMLGVTVITAFAATTYTLGGDAEIVAGGNLGNAAQIRTDVTIAPYYGFVRVVPDTPIAWGDLATLSTDFNVTNDSCGGGSPRIQVAVDTDNNNVSDGNVFIALGPSPNFTGCTTGWQSTGNLIGNEDAGRYDYGQLGGSSFTTYSNAPALVLTGKVLRISVVVDSSWSAAATGGDGEQTVLIDNINLNGDITTFDIVRTAEITSPAEDAEVSGLVNFTAYLVDDDEDSIQWAVRKGTCAAGTGTVFGNVDGHSDIATINQSDLSNQTFSFVGDMSLMDSGMYCFIYNPAEDSGESGIRETVEFNLVKATPTDKEECKKGGWESFSNPTFKNQGDCVSYMESNINADKRIEL